MLLLFNIYWLGFPWVFDAGCTGAEYARETGIPVIVFPNKKSLQDIASSTSVHTAFCWIWCKFFRHAAGSELKKGAKLPVKKAKAIWYRRREANRSRCEATCEKEDQESCESSLWEKAKAIWYRMGGMDLFFCLMGAVLVISSFVIPQEANTSKVYYGSVENANSKGLSKSKLKTPADLVRQTRDLASNSHTNKSWQPPAVFRFHEYYILCSCQWWSWGVFQPLLIFQCLPW